MQTWGQSGRLSRAVASFGLGVARGGPFKIGGGDVVEEEVEGGAEEFAVPVLEMSAQLILMGQKGIEGAVEPVIVDLVARNTKEIVQGCLVVP